MKQLVRVLAVALAVTAAASAMHAAELRAPAHGDVAYVSGGIGSEEAAAMRKEEWRYPLSIEFAMRSETGTEYVAGVAVGISDRYGKPVLTTVTDGPVLLARLPNGRYTVTADLDGRTKSQAVVVTAQQPKHLRFVW